MCFSCNCVISTKIREIFLDDEKQERKRLRVFLSVPKHPKQTHDVVRCASPHVFFLSHRSSTACARLPSIHFLIPDSFSSSDLHCDNYCDLHSRRAAVFVVIVYFCNSRTGQLHWTIRNFEQTGLNCTLVCQMVQLGVRTLFKSDARTCGPTQSRGVLCA
jgi:hypothetical protein